MTKEREFSLGSLLISMILMPYSGDNSIVYTIVIGDMLLIAGIIGNVFNNIWLMLWYCWYANKQYAGWCCYSFIMTSLHVL